MTALYLVQDYPNVPPMKGTLSGLWRGRQGQESQGRSRSTQDRPHGRARLEWCRRSCQEDSQWGTARRVGAPWGSHNSRGGAWRPKGENLNNLKTENSIRIKNFITFHSSIKAEGRRISRYASKLTIVLLAISSAHCTVLANRVRPYYRMLIAEWRSFERYLAKAKDHFSISKV